MRDEQNGAAGFAMRLEHGEDPLLRLAVDFASRLVGDQYRRPRRQRDRQPSARCLTAGKLSRIGVTALADSDHLQHFAHARWLAFAGESQLEADVLIDSEVIEQVSRLKQYPDLLCAHRRARLLISPRQPVAIHVHEPTVRLVESRQAGDESGLAASRRADDGDDLTGLHRQAHAAKSLRFVVPDVIESV